MILFKRVRSCRSSHNSPVASNALRAVPATAHPLCGLSDLGFSSSPRLTRPRPHWLLRCSSNKRGRIPPTKELVISSAPSFLPPDSDMTKTLTFYKSLLNCHLFKETNRDVPFKNCIPYLQDSQFPLLYFDFYSHNIYHF